MRWMRFRALAIVVALGVCAGNAQAQRPALGSPLTIDGPSSSIVAVGGISIARDGSGGVVYLKQVGGVAHVFVSRLQDGVFQPPEQVDSPLSGASSQPVIAAGNGGLLLIAFVNGGALYTVDRADTSAPYLGPISLFAGALNPAIRITNFGKAYLAFAASAGGGGYDVRAAYYYRGTWSLEPSSLNAVPADDAGTGTGRPAVAAAGDGVGIVVWGEGGHIYSRRVWGTAASVVYEQADVPTLSGWNEVTADDPVAGVGGDSSYVEVAFREELTNGSEQQSRVLRRRLRASQYDTVTQPDGLSTPALEGADQPQVAVGEYGSGVITSEHQTSHELFATLVTGAAASGATFRVDSIQNFAAPDAVAATAGLYADLIAWQHDPGGVGTPEIRVRYAPDGTTFGPELVVSSPGAGPTAAASGLAAAGDIDGNAAVVWEQGTASGTRVEAAQLYRAPGSFGPLHSFGYSRSRHPLLHWTPARDDWRVRYEVAVDGVSVGAASATSFAVPSTLPDGRHRWQVTAVNGAGGQSVARPATVWVDAVPPGARLAVSGARRRGARIRIRVAYTDSPPGEPPADASGIAGVVVHWGDGSIARIHRGRHRGSHVYAGRGRFKLTVVVKDRAGNRTVVVRYLTIR
jgi:hypothetical protein